MNDDLVYIGSMLWNAILIGALGAMIKTWMADTHKKIESHCQSNEREHSKLFEKLVDHETRISRVEVKVDI